MPANIEQDLIWLAQAGFIVAVKASPKWDAESSLELMLSNPYIDEVPERWSGDDPSALMAEARAWVQVRGHGPPGAAEG
jgi:hypothetical protein